MGSEMMAKPGPYKEIIDSDVFVNCIYLSDGIPPFVNDRSLSDPDCKLSVVEPLQSNPHLQGEQYV
jgi:saccharopine dehydrogenase (NAD+, L-lysine-forming)